MEMVRFCCVMCPTKMKTVEIWTDGACIPNPGNGGWAWLSKVNGQEQEKSGTEPETTSNRMEMMAAICAIESLPLIPDKIILHTDSQYLCKGFMSWRHKWKGYGWKLCRKLNASEPKNLDLWKVLDRLATGLDIELIWVRGHDGQAENEQVDNFSFNGARGH
jgi:ribonuclease HI